MTGTASLLGKTPAGRGASLLATAAKSRFTIPILVALVIFVLNPLPALAFVGIGAGYLALIAGGLTFGFIRRTK